MRRHLGHIVLGVGLGVLCLAASSGEVKGAAIYRITMTITDDTTHSAPVTYTVNDGGANDTNATSSGITVSAALNTSATGILLTGINSSTTSTSAGTQLTIGGSANVVSGSSDMYTILITTTHDTYNLPTGTTGTLGQSESGTYTYTNAGNTQGFQSWYNPGSAPDVTAGVTPGPQSISIPTATGTPSSGNANNPTDANIPGYVVPYTLTNQIMIVVTGNGTSNNSSIQFQGSTTVSAYSVPEPASIVMLLTGMPVPLVVLGMLRRRKAVRRTDLAAE